MCMKDSTKSSKRPSNPITDPKVRLEYQGDVPIDELTAGSSKVFPWKCSLKECGHVWKTRVSHRTNGSMCPKCKTRLRAEADQKKAAERSPIKDPVLLAEYRGEGSLSDYGAGSSKIVPWECSKCAHEWKAEIGNRTRSKGCPKCSSKNAGQMHKTASSKANPVVDELLLSEYKGQFPITDYSKGSRDVVPWQCSKCSHKWETSFRNRNAGSGCPKCAIEIAAKTRQLTAAKKHPIDSKQMIAEYAGSEPIENFSSKSGLVAPWHCQVKDCGHKWDESFADRSKSKGCPACVQAKLRAERKAKAKDDPIINEQLFKEYRGEFPLEEYPAGSSARMPWQCSASGCGAKWTQIIKVRVKGGGCPECKQTRSQEKAILKREKSQSLEETRLANLITDEFLIQEYMGPGKLTDYTKGSNQRGSWRCSVENCKHEWEAAISSRALRGSGCLACSAKQRSIDIQIRAAKKSSITNEKFITEYRGQEPLENFSRGSGIKLPWKCSILECGCEWEASPAERHKSPGGHCPECARKAGTLAFLNQAAIKNPIKDPLLLKEYRGQKPIESFAAGSGEIVPWECSNVDCGNKWNASFGSRTSGGACPVCVRLVAVEKRRITAAIKKPITNPYLIAQYRGSEPIENFSTSSTVIVPWQCNNAECGRTWQASFHDRRNVYDGCPACGDVYGFKHDKPASVYFVVNPDKQIGKVGVSNVVDKRLSTHHKNGYTKRIEVWNFDKGSEARAVEKAILSEIRVSLEIPAIQGLGDGWTETFALDEFESKRGCEGIEYVYYAIERLIRDLV